jgi:hypothetical protein
MTSKIIKFDKLERGPAVRRLQALSQREQVWRARKYYNEQLRPTLQGFSVDYEFLQEVQRSAVWLLYCLQQMWKVRDVQSLAWFYEEMKRTDEVPSELKAMLHNTWPRGKAADATEIVPALARTLYAMFAGPTSLLTIIDLEGDDL